MSKFQKSRPFQTTVSLPYLYRLYARSGARSVLSSWPQALAVVNHLGGATFLATGNSVDVHVITVITTGQNKKLPKFQIINSQNETCPLHWPTNADLQKLEPNDPAKNSTLYPDMINIHQQHNHSFSRGNLANLPFSPDELRIL